MRWLPALILLALPAAVLAQPDVTSVGGTIEDGAVAEVRGGNFGGKVPVIPIHWDTFEGGGTELLSLFGHWRIESDNVSADQPRYYALEQRPGTTSLGCARVPITASQTGQRDFFYHSYSALFDQTYFISFWAKYPAVTSSQRGQYFQVSAGTPIQESRPYLGFYNAESEGTRLTQVRNTWDCVFSANLDDTTTNPMSVDQWVNVRIQVDHGKAGMADGNMKVWLDGVLEIDQQDTRYIRTGCDGHDTPWFGGWNYLYGGTIAVLYDDVYIDHFWARVEVGDNENYLACTKFEVQYPTDWSDTVITINLNRGSFQVGEDGFVFVTDDAGLVNALGKKITWTESVVPIPCDGYPN